MEGTPNHVSAACAPGLLKGRQVMLRPVIGPEGHCCHTDKINFV